MSPRHVESPLIKSVKTYKVKRSVNDNKVKNSHSRAAGSGWLGKRGQSSVPPSSFDRDLLNLYSDGPLEKLREESPDSSSAVRNLKFAAFKAPRASSPCVDLSTFLSLSPHVPSSPQCDTSMRGRTTRASTDSSEPGMPSGSGSSRLTSPMGRSEKDSDMASPETPKSGKRKRQPSHDKHDSPKSRNKAAKASVFKINADEIIEVDDTDTPPAKPLRALRSATVLTDYSKVCEFPVGTKDSVSVCLADYKTLQHDTFLNDIIIDFYLTYLNHKFLNKEDRPTVHIFSTMFYKRLNSTPKKASTVASYEKDSSLKPAEKRHLRVKGWTKNVNLFEKNMVIIPICEHSHWYLVIAIRPGLITIPLGSEERHTKGEPFMIVLDSMGGNKAAAVTNIRHYLAAEWKAKMCGDEGDEDEYEFTSKEMKTVRPQKPEQENYSDCGIYLLHYIEMMFKSVAQYYWPSSIQDLSTWFAIEEISIKRDEIARLIRDLSDEQNLDKEMKFPENIPFLPPIAVTRSKKRRQEFEHSSESEEEDDWGKGHVLGGSSSGIGAAGFYGERCGGPSRILRNGDSSSNVGSGDSDVSSHTASEIAREQRHRNRDQRSKDPVPAVLAGQAGPAGSAKSCKDSAKDSNKSRVALVNKLQQIKGASSAFDEVRKYKIPKTVKPKQSDSEVIGDLTVRRVGRVPSGDSVIVVTDNSAASTSSQQKTFVTSVVPSARSPKKSEKSRQVSHPGGRNSIVNSLQIKSRADLHQENCLADLHKIEAEMEEEEDLKADRKRTKHAALKAFREDQKAIHESIVNEASRNSSVENKSQKQFSKSLPIPKKKTKSSPEKRKVLQNKVLEDLLELEEEGNTEDEEEEEVTEKVKVLQIEDETEPEIRIRKIKNPKSKEAFRSIITEKVKISRDGKELCKVTPETETASQREITPIDEEMEEMETMEYIESPLNSPDVTTVEDTPEITTVEDTPEISAVDDAPEITTVDSSSEVTTIDDPPPEEVVSIGDDFPLVGFLEKVEVAPPVVVPIPVSKPKETIRSRKSTSEPTDLVVVRKSTSEPDSPQPKVNSKSTSEPVSPLVKKFTSEPDSIKHIRTIPKPNLPKLKANPPYAIAARQSKVNTISESELPRAKSIPEPDLVVIKSEPEVVSKSTSEPASPLFKKSRQTKFQTTREPEHHQISEPDLIVVRNSTSEPNSHQPKVIRKSTSEPVSPLIKKSRQNKLKTVSEREPYKAQFIPDPDLVFIRNSTSDPDCSPFKIKSKSTPEPKSPLTKKSRQNKLKATREPDLPTVKSIPEPELFHSKSTAEPVSPFNLEKKSTSEAHSQIFSRAKKSTSEPADVVLKKQKAKTFPKIQIDTDSDDEGNSSGSDCSFSLPKRLETSRASQRPKRERKFSNLSEIERAKLKNIPTSERLEILAKANKLDKKVKTPSERNQLSKENPFYLSPRGAKTVQQQRGSKSRNSTASDTSEIEGHFHADSSNREDPIQIDYKSSNKVATTSKRKFKLQNHGKLSPSNLKISNVRSTNNFENFAEERFVSDSGSDCTDIYTTDDL